MATTSPERPSVAICVATYMRPDTLHQLLVRLQKLNMKMHMDILLRIIVVDNDPSGTAKEVVARSVHAMPWQITYHIEPGEGITYARNRLVELASDCEFVVFVDDDEIVEPSWLDHLLTAQTVHYADVVAGPVLSRFEESTADWISRGKFFDRDRHVTGTPVRYIATGNVLIRRAVLDDIAGPFDHRFALTGGEDTFLFLRLHAAGARMVWCNEAVVTETVSAQRTTLKWILKRSFRVGNTLARCERLMGSGYSQLALRGAKGIALVAYGCISAGPSCLRGRHHAALRMAQAARGVGMIAGLLNRSYEEYGRTLKRADRKLL